MIPNKINWFMGYNSLAIILEQEKKHWMLKTDKKKQLQDNKTGDMFQGQIDNLGSDIIIETEKLPIKNDIVQSISFEHPSAEKILSISPSAFPYSSEVNGLMFSRITSTNFPWKVGTETQFKHYKLKLENCETCSLLFGNINSSDVFAYKWLKTSTPPKLLMLGDDGQYSIEQVIKFNDNITNPVFYYPLTNTLQPLDISEESKGVYISEAVNNDGFIGYPLYWFTCNQSNIGPILSIDNNLSPNNEKIVHVSNEGNASKYIAKMYFVVDSLSATPDGISVFAQQYKITCSPKEGYSFDSVSEEIPIDPSSISLTHRNGSFDEIFNLGINCSDNYVITTTGNDWEYNDNIAECSLQKFYENSYNDFHKPLKAAFKIHFDESVPFNNITNDTGCVGIRMSSSNLYSDSCSKYPYSLNDWDGLPEWMNNMDDDMLPQYMSIYAIHNTPSYDPNIPNSRQTAALLLDPGLIKTDGSKDELSNDERGRVYMLSNDDSVYENNSITDNPKPDRTVARICDIPTSAMQLSGIHDIAPVSIVDKKYVRSEASFSVEDKNRLYNILGNRWVKPSDLDYEGNPLTNANGQDNKSVFNSVDILNKVDLVHHNLYRTYENINPMVEPSNVCLANITNPGKGYKEDDIGIVVVGGFGFHYTITGIDDEGSVEDLIITPTTSGSDISLSNFDLMDDLSGITESYGTSPISGKGRGLKFRLLIKNYQKIIPYKGEIVSGLFAFVKEKDGIWLYNYIINQESKEFPKTGSWVKDIMVSETEQTSSVSKNEKGVSLTESYINSIIPSLRDVPVNLYQDKSEPTTLHTLSTPSFVNIIDNTKSPIAPQVNPKDDDPDITHVDMCKFYCNGIIRLRASRKNVDSVIDAIKTNNIVRYNSYIFWKWESKNDINNLYFTCGVIHRSFNNLLSTDVTSTLPPNELICDNFINSNEGTTVVWDVNNVGVMMWTYNPEYQKREIYNIDPSTQDLYAERRDLTWDDIDIRDSKNSDKISLVEDGVLLYNILSNNPVQTSSMNPNNINPNPIYQQSDIYPLPGLTEGALISSISSYFQPMGNWQLVFPRLNSFKLKNLSDGREFSPVNMQIVRGSNMGKISDIENSHGKKVNTKSIIVDETSEGLSLKMYNSETGIWEKI